MVGSPARRRAFVHGLDELSDRLEALYTAIASAGSARVIVDSSKLPTYGLVLDQVHGVDLHVVHLVRDPRATAYSWRRRKSLPDKRGGGFMQQQGPLKASALWTMWNTGAATFWRHEPGRYLRVRYEDFVREPQETIERICAFAGEPFAGSPFVSANEVELAPSHSVAGNPSRFTTGRVVLRPDDEWRTKMRTMDRAVVTAVTWPLLLRHTTRGPA
jgi:sulfotransferase family protein